MTFKIGVDVGGTFTDFLLMDADGDSKIFKVLSTPEDPSEAVLDGLVRMAEATGNQLPGFLGQVEIIVHGTTVTTNAVLTGNVARTGLLTTRGFRDALQMRRGVREELYNNKFQPPEPLVPRYLRLPVTERVDHEGQVRQSIRLEDVDSGAEEFDAQQVAAVAVCFMHAYANDENERAARKRLERLMPGTYLSISSEVLPQVRFYDRVSTTVLNSAVGPILKRYVDKLIGRLEDGGFGGILLIMQSNGGVTTPAEVVRLASSTLLSGPAAAPVAGIAYTAMHDEKSFITVDMGGTSFDAALVKDGRPLVTTEGRVNGNALALPMMQINTIGAGGGSVAWIDDGGLLKMGPESAGARPGPVCYGLGGKKPTCSDANLVLGYLSADYFAGGRMRLDGDAAAAAIAEIVAGPLGLDLVAAAHGMYRLMNVNMASAIREISVQRGFDPRDFLMVCAGGAGPIHAAEIAGELEIGRILVPKESSIFCAAGMLLSDLQHDFVRSHHGPFTRAMVDDPGFAGLVSDLRRAGDATLAGENIPPQRRAFAYSLDLRYTGQYHEVCVDVTLRDLQEKRVVDIRDSFHAAHNRHYGYDLKDEGTGVELVNLRLTATGRTDKPRFRREPFRGKDPSGARKGRRPVFIPSQMDFEPVDVYDGDRMGFGHTLVGPAIVEQVNTTIFVPPGCTLECDPYGSFMMTFG